MFIIQKKYPYAGGYPGGRINNAQQAGIKFRSIYGYVVIAVQQRCLVNSNGNKVTQPVPEGVTGRGINNKGCSWFEQPLMCIFCNDVGNIALGYIKAWQ